MIQVKCYLFKFSKKNFYDIENVMEFENRFYCKYLDFSRFRYLAYINGYI
jgi:hypothetical protein